MRVGYINSFAAMVVMLAASSPADAQFVFAPTQTIDFGFDAGPTSIGFGDLNEDQFLDLVVSGRNLEGVVLILMGKADGGFEPAVQMEMGGLTDWVIVEQLDGDLHLDLVIALQSGVGKVAVFKGNGDGTFGPRVDYDVGRGPTQIVARDFDGDEDIDLAVMNNGSETVSMLLNDGNAVFSAGQTMHVGQLLKGTAVAFYFTSGDFDGDKDEDLAVAKTAGSIAVLMNNGNATFAKPIDYAGATPTGIASGDVDSDGDVDIVFADLINLFEPGFLGVLRNQGGGNFEGIELFPAGGNTMWYATLADLNGNGKPDAILTDALGSNMVLFENQTVGQNVSFSAPQPIGLAGFPRSVFPVDLDGDCDLDLLVANIGAHVVQILINETPQEKPCKSSARFGAAAKTSPPRTVKQRSAANHFLGPLEDFNGDGKMDAADGAVLLGRWEENPARSTQQKGKE